MHYTQLLKKGSLLILLWSCLIVPNHFALAQGSFLDGFGDAKNIASEEGIQQTDLKAAILTAVRILLGFVAVLAFAVFILGGFMYITAAGNEDRASRGKQMIWYAIIGLLIIGLSALAVNFIISLVTGSGQNQQKQNQF